MRHARLPARPLLVCAMRNFGNSEFPSAPLGRAGPPESGVNFCYPHILMPGTRFILRLKTAIENPQV